MKDSKLPALSDCVTPEHMREALGQVGALLHAGEPVPVEWLQWLGAALRKVGQGEDAKSALELKSPRGRPRKTTPEEVERAFLIAEFPMIDSETGAELQPGRKLTHAELAEILEVDIKTIQRNLAAWRKQWEKMLDEMDDQGDGL